MTKWRIITWLAGLTGLSIIILVLFFALVLPRIVDSRAAKEKIRALFLRETKGTVTIENIDLRWLPRPTVVIRSASFSVADKGSGTIQSIRVYPSILGLLMGQWVTSRVDMASPAVVVRVPKRSEAPLNIDEIEGNIRSMLATLASRIPGMVVDITGGSAEIRIGDRPSVVITDLDARLVAPPGEMDLRISARANVFDQLRVDARIAGRTLETTGRIRLERLRLRESIASLLPRPPGYIEDGDVNLDLRLTSVGLKKIRVEVDASLPSLGLARGRGKRVIKIRDLKGFATHDEGIFRAVITRLDLALPKLTASGDMTIDTSSSAVRLKMEGQNVDVAGIRDSALTISGDVDLVQNIFQYVRGGTISEFSFETSGRSLADLGNTENMAVAVKMRGGRIFVPGPNLDLEEVSGSVAISGGVLEGKECSARLANTEGKDGAFRLGLEGQGAPFQLDIMVQADAAELRSLLLRVVKDEVFRRELSRIRDAEGELSGRLILGGRTDSLSPKVSVFKTAISASYDPIPYPIAVKEGRLDYDDGKITVEGVTGAIGRSSFSGLTGSLHNDGARQIEITSGSISLDLQQAEDLLSTFEALQKSLKDVHFARGKLDLVSLFLKGPLDNPSRWDFRGAGSVGGIAVTHAKLPGVMNVSRGRFSATAAKFMLSDASVEMLDASLTVGAILESSDKAPLSLEATGTGIIGGQMTGWLSRQIELPEQLVLRPPLQLTEGRVFWRKDGDISFRGKLTVGDGARVSLDMIRGPETVKVKELIIADGGQRAHMTLDLERDKLALSFKGAMEEKTLNRMFQSPPLQGGLLQGDIEISAFIDQTLRFSARGRLEGRDLFVPLKSEPALVEKFLVEGDEDGVKIRSADLRWRGSHISVSGKLAAAKEALHVDLDVSADRLAWEEFSEVMGRDDRQGDKGNARVPLPPLEGVIRLKTDSFALGTLYWKPLQVTAELTPSGISGEVTNSVVCGIRTAGRFTAQKNDEIELDVRLSVRNGELESTTKCLTSEKSDISGTYSLDAHLTGGGNRERLARTLSGGFEFVARDGKFIRSAGVDATFDYLNDTGAFNMVFPDLDKGAFPYRLISAKGTIERQSVLAKELIIEASPYTITGQGKLDLEQKTIEGKGLVTVLLPAEKTIKRIPLIGSIVGSSMVGIPVEVTGSFDQPRVTYLSPAALGTELLHLPARILKVPYEAIQIFTPSDPGSDKTMTK